MEKWVLLYFALFNLKAFAQDTWLGIDCGSATSTTTIGGVWQTDGAFIKTGTNQFVSSDNFQTLALLNTLRAFPMQNKNCYALPARATRYFIRAIFLYGNYDNLLKPPTFDLEIDGNKWMTVVSSSTEILHYEIIYTSTGDTISVCLARTQANQFPFISSLEAWPIFDSNAYIHMNRDLAWLNTYRYNYGANDWILGYPLDTYNRLWEPMAQSGLLNTSADNGTILTTKPYEYPPDSAVLDAMEAQNATDSISLSFGPIKLNSLIYIEAYFTAMSLDEVTETREFGFYVGNKQLATVFTEYGKCTAIWALVQRSSSSLTIELRPTKISTLPPIISAIEVYTASDPLVTTRTSQNDLDGLEVFISTFQQLKGWSGEPCLPTNMAWQWLGCTGSDPPRVTSINLSGYNLSGFLPDFSQMQALENIDLSNNSLGGQIPEFLGNLPYLKTLNLQYNDFSGRIPSSISNNKRITYNIEGNTNLDASHKNKSTTALIIGLSVGLSLVIILILVALTYWLIQKRAHQGQNQATGPESGAPPVAQGSPPKMNSASVSIGASTEQLLRPQPPPSAPMEPSMEEDFEQNSDEDYVPVSDANQIHQSMVPEMDLEELEDIIKQHENNAHDDLSSPKSRS
ncbi:Leucine-rich repeat transmembrane protein kinase protein [Abeliophyllum distichum]|uniref:Leucine-rich repeat transmembrane protein kinase protein n=1 Tax=Abeliophyllum distichum TaxID=126358 RepID=A0ABD1Q2M6_9LAMI